MKANETKKKRRNERRENGGGSEIRWRIIILFINIGENAAVG
jgi:hypothetical protein